MIWQSIIEVMHVCCAAAQVPMLRVCFTVCVVLSVCCCHMSAAAGWMTHPADSQDDRWGFVGGGGAVLIESLVKVGRGGVMQSQRQPADDCIAL